MYELLTVVGLLPRVVEAVTWLLLLGFGAWLYIRLRLRSLPWLGAYAALAMPLHFVTRLLVQAVVDRGALPGGWVPGKFLIIWGLGDGVLRSLTSLLVAVIVVAEVAGLLARLSPGPEWRALRLLRGVRENPVPFGLTLVVLTLAGPLVAAILWLTTPAAGANQAIAVEESGRSHRLLESDPTADIPAFKAKLRKLDEEIERMIEEEERQEKGPFQ